MSYLVYGERLSGVNWTGAALIVASICLGELRVLPPPPSWVPDGLRARWARMREAQLSAAAALDAPCAEMQPAPQADMERVGLLAAGDSA
jgi:hypothetical protein